MSYIYSVRGWLELSWPDAEYEGVDETPEEHAAKIERIHELLTPDLAADELEDDSIDASERYKLGWAFPQHDLGGTEYVLFGADVEEPSEVMATIRRVLAIDPFADGYFSVEGEDGERCRQWLIKSGTVYGRSQLFPDFDSEDLPAGYSEVFPSASS